MEKRSRLRLNQKGSTFGSNFAGLERGVSSSATADSQEGGYVPFVLFVLLYGCILYQGRLVPAIETWDR